MLTNFLFLVYVGPGGCESRLIHKTYCDVKGSILFNMWYYILLPFLTGNFIVLLCGTFPQTILSIMIT